jgi:hypothetical protein
VSPERRDGVLGFGSELRGKTAQAKRTENIHQYWIASMFGSMRRICMYMVRRCGIVMTKCDVFAIQPKNGAHARL